ncbi:macrophage mannose receptor 1-like isoform X1 [Xyrauchen texanus]|uniref:macrophage mannose receptor 1-like isoform X1 n=1 Tax=Xyrauchen texanus TaxID=154827 RepID=UPI0022423DB0|nr:macrophage mannose receptor 1-like isoform X1 [Xyrauchen texanus]
MEGNTSIALLLSAVFSECVSRQYHFVNQKLSWSEAQRYCRENYTDLVTINNKNDIEELLKSVNDDQVQFVWIGLHKTNIKTWKWSLGDPAFYTGSDSQYRNWAHGQPNEDEDCSNMNTGEWCDYNCTHSTQLTGFICYNDSSKGHIPVHQSVIWRNAQSFCRDHHTDLVSVRNLTENTQIEKIRTDGGMNAVWIGLFRDSWEWSDESESSFRNWRTSVPDNVGGNENCAELWVKTERGRWDDRNCDIKTPFVCHEDELVLIRLNVSWNEALRYCRENHVDLVSVHSEQIQHQVTEVVKDASTAAVWMGLHHYCAMNMWIWLRGEVVCYQNWAAGHGTGQEDCGDGPRVGAVQSGGDQRWISLPQTHKLNFICTNSQD